MVELLVLFFFIIPEMKQFFDVYWLLRFSFLRSISSCLLPLYWAGSLFLIDCGDSSYIQDINAFLVICYADIFTQSFYQVITSCSTL